MSSTENNYVNTDLGNVALNSCGEYNADSSYEYLDTVNYEGGSYFCKVEFPKKISGIAPKAGVSTEFWQLLTIPGDATSEYIKLHDEVVNKAKQVETSRAAVELSQTEVEAAQTDVSQMRQDTQEAAEEAASSRDSAAGYAQSAEASRTAAKESEDNINAQVTGFDVHAAEKTSETESAITEARRVAVNAVSTKQDDATQAVIDEGDKQIKNVEDAGTEQVGKAKSAGESAVSAAGAAGVSAVNAVKAQQTASIKAIQEAGKNALQNISNGVDKGLSEEGKAADAKATGEAISKLTEDLEISLLENDRLYEGTNLAEKFKDEIANYSDIWQWIKARIKAGNFAGIHVNDFIRWQTTDNKWIESRIAGINTYRGYGDREVPNHIDFISKDLWPTLHVMNPVNYNNGIIPTENLSGDGTKTAFVLTNEMASIASVTIGGTAVTSYTYDIDTHTITFTDAPVAGTNNIVVTGTGSEYPWLASDLYLYANSLKGHVADGTSKTSPVKLVDYTKDGIWSKLPEALKAVIVVKRALHQKRYSDSGVLSNSNSWGWENMGKLWIPSEMEVYGCEVWGNNKFDNGGFVQYPIFNCCNTNRVKGLGDGGSRYAWWLMSSGTGSTSLFCNVGVGGNANSTIAADARIGAPVCFRISV